ncbi:MAG: Sulfide dehydrogenase subunit alpha [Candidatus Argoarchaeum ethanivorans]|uniref:Sulfide dehydrogenase subunit alpha n=1 Tax=Candidatus Argoarchaeum ethanivorans TaxID=2608793 RepID=A0A811TDD6_9EURY|nr:MAG: Sulfide dehydrogenase subunit alpha [Candidatus Argoarchaeum ethanivorans]CAD6493682.1 MAG: Sulfide dehydrogenase subunit alpha [Candidatus Argoarchaeum ethanivorans]
MPEQDPEERIHNFDEVALGYTEEQATIEANRCLQCKKPQCIKGCPVEIDIPAFIKNIAEGDFEASASELKRANTLPAICGRVCPQEMQCEIECTLGKKGEPIAIGRLERFAADYELEKGVQTPGIPESTGYRVAVVGSGPASLTVAADLARIGHSVTILEALHEEGGVLIYGIPEFRLPKEIVRAEVDFIKKLGVEIKLNFVVGKLRSVDELLTEYDAVFLGSGAGLPSFLGIEGENLNGVYSANEFLTRVNLMKAYQFPDYDTPIKKGKHVVVVGAGNVAMDAARCALRLGAENVTIVYRRGEDEMTARIEEIRHAKEEGVHFKLLTNPTIIYGDENNWVKTVKCIKMRLGEPDESGRARPEPISGTEHEIPADVAVIAIGTTPNPLIPSTTSDLQTIKRNIIPTDAECRTSKKGVFAGGDVVTGSATVISAMGAGKIAARAIDQYLQSLRFAETTSTLDCEAIECRNTGNQ